MFYLGTLGALLQELTNQELHEDIGIASLGHRKQVLKEIRAIKHINTKENVNAYSSAMDLDCSTLGTELN